MKEPLSSDAPETWREYVESETARLLEEAGHDLALAMIHSRAIETPEFYKARFKQDVAEHYSVLSGNAGFWQRIALRAVVLLKVPLPVREQLIEEAWEREEAARAAVRANLKKGPGGPYRPVDLTDLEI